MKKMQTQQQGFTLIELMIVVAIIGILASIAIPAYQDYMTRSKWSKAISGVAAMKLAIGECLNDNGADLPSCDTSGELGSYGITTFPSGASVESATVTLVANTAAISIAGGANLGSCTFLLTPTVDTGAGTISWVPKTADSACIKFIKGATST